MGIEKDLAVLGDTGVDLSKVGEYIDTCGNSSHKRVSKK